MAAQPTFPAINVVPSGYRWTREAAQKAAEKGAFLRVGGPTVTRRYLSGAWRKNTPEEQSAIFNVTYRITGTPEAVTGALTYAGFSPAEVQAAVADSITRDNAGSTKAGVYNAEIAAHAARRHEKPVTEGYDWPQILWFGQNIKAAQIGTKSGETRGAVAAGGRAGAGESIATKLEKLQAGKVLDVSNMDLATGKGVRSVPAPKTAKSGKFGTQRVRIISNDLSRYVRALELAYGAGAQQQYADDIAAVRQALSVGTAPAPALAAPVPRPPSPARLPGATLAAAPAFRAATPRAVPTLGAAFPPMPRV